MTIGFCDRGPARAFTVAALGVLCVLNLPGEPAGAEDAPGKGGFPPFVSGPADLDAFFENIFGTTAEDQQALEAIEVSAEDERRLGGSMVETYVADAKRRRIAVLKRGSDVAYLEQLVRTLQPQMENAERYESIRVLVLDTPQFEARSFPGGTLAFSRGLLDFAGSEAALVGVIGHELSHLDHGHQLLPIRRMTLMQKLAPTDGRGFSPQAMVSTGQTLMKLSRPFRPEDEAAADRDAVVWSFKAGYDPQALADLFLRLEQRQQSPKFPVPAMFRSHPVNEARRQAVLAVYDELAQDDADQPLYVGIENLRRRMPRSKQAFPE